jgi:hypothetical protein
MNLEPIVGADGSTKRRAWRYVVYAGAAICVLIDIFLVHPHHVYFPWDKIPGANAVMGLVFTGATIVFAKLIIGKIIYRKENYYD